MNKTIDGSLPIFISADNSIVENVVPQNKTSFTLQELYKLIDTDLVEVVNLFDGTIMIIDEESKIKGNPVVNKLASQLFSVDRMNENELKGLMNDYEVFGFVTVGISDRDLGLPHNSICGNVVVCLDKYFI